MNFERPKSYFNFIIIINFKMPLLVLEDEIVLKERNMNNY